MRCVGVILWMLEILMQWVLTPVAVKTEHVEAATRMAEMLRHEIDMEVKIESVRDTTSGTPGS